MFLNVNDRNEEREKGSKRKNLYGRKINNRNCSNTNLFSNLKTFILFSEPGLP